MLVMRPTPSLLLIQDRLGEPLEPYVQRLRADERTWRYIARHLAQKTGHEVTGEWLRRQFGAAA